MAEIITVERRRRWSDEDKRRIVGEAQGPRGGVSAVAKRYGLYPSQIFSWRRALRDRALRAEGAGAFAPVVIGEAAALASSGMPAALDGAPLAACGRIEIILGGGRRVVVGSDVDAAALRRVLDVLERR